MRGDIDLMGGPNFDRLYHKLKVLLLLSCHYMMQFVSYDSINSLICILSLSNSHNNAASIQKHRTLIDPTLMISIAVALIFQ